jgi:hypothetical protein
VQKAGKGVRGKRCGVYRVLGPLCMLGCSSVVVVEGAFVRDCRGKRVYRFIQVD